MMLTDSLVYRLVEQIFEENGKGPGFYDVDMFISDIEQAIEVGIEIGKYETDSDSYNEVLSGLMGWLRSADGVDNWDDSAACILFLELEAWACKKFRSEED